MSMSPVQVELEALRESNDGLLTAEAVVQFAQENPDSALHKRFQWDNDVASHQYRLQQARQIVRMFVTVVPRSSQTIRAYVSLMPDRQLPGGGYRSLGDVMTNDDRRQMLLRQALRDAERFRLKYQGLEELAAIFGEIDTATAILMVNTDTTELLQEQAGQPAQPAPAA